MPPAAVQECNILQVPWSIGTNEADKARKICDIDRLLKKNLPSSVRKKLRGRSSSYTVAQVAKLQQSRKKDDLDFSFHALVSPEIGTSSQCLMKNTRPAVTRLENNTCKGIFDTLFEGGDIDDHQTTAIGADGEYSVASSCSGASTGAVVASSLSIPITHSHVALCMRYFQRGRMHLQNKRDELSMKCFRSALEMSRGMFGAFHPRVGTMLVDIGGVFLAERGNIRKSLKFYLAALEVMRRYLEEEHPDLAEYLNRIGHIYVERAEYTKAMKYFNETLALKDEEDNASSPISIKDRLILHRADAVLGLGHIYFYRGEYALALNHYEIAMQTKQHHLGPTNEKVAVIIHYIGMLKASTGHNGEAFSYALEALQMRRSVLGDDHASIGESLNAIASICIDEGTYQRAFPILKEALKIQQNTLGLNHIDVARTMNNIGITYIGGGKAQRAIRLYIKSIKIVENTVRKNHPFIGDALLNLGDAYSECDDYESAMNCFNRSLHIYHVNKIPDFHPCVVRAMESVFGVQYKQDRSC